MSDATNPSRIVALDAGHALDQLARCLRQEEPVAPEIVVAGTAFQTRLFLEQAAKTMRGPAPTRLTGEIGIDDGTMTEAIISLSGRLKQQGLLQ